MKRRLAKTNKIGMTSSYHSKPHAMTLRDFFAHHAVFTVGEVEEFLAARGSGNAHTRRSLLAHHVSRGRILPVRRGLYATVPRGLDVVTAAVDPYLIAARLTDDAILAYHTAQEFHGRAHTVHWRLVYLSDRRSAPLAFQLHEFRRAPPPPALRRSGGEMFGVDHRDRSGVEIRVTNHERTLVDLLDRPELTGSWSEIWQSLEAVEFFDLDQIVEYARLLGNATTAAKVGFFLEQHRETLMVDDGSLRALRRLRPRGPHYLDRGHHGRSRLVKEWNLMVPEEILDRTWEEPS